MSQQIEIQSLEMEERLRQAKEQEQIPEILNGAGGKYDTEHLW